MLCVVSLNLPELGPVSRALGVLATLMRDYTRAELHLADALARSERIGAPPHIARTLVERARMLLSHRAQGDEQQAHEMLAKAIPLAEQMGMTGLIADIAAMERAS